MKTHGRMIGEKDERFYIGKSSLRGAGLGLFARKTLSRGAKLKIVGAFVKPGSISDACTHFADRHKFRVGAELLIPFGFAGIVNHSKIPNLEKVILSGRQVYLRALRPIRKDEELFFTYHEYAQRRFAID